MTAPISDTEAQPSGRWLALVLATAVLAVSSSAVIVRHLPDVDAPAIAWWRCLSTALLLSPSMGRVALADAWRVLVAGICLGAHFAAWFASIKLTTVLHATVLVCLTPVWVGLFEGLVLRQPPGRGYWPGLAAAIAGVLWMTGDAGDGASLWGDALAVLASLLSTAYVLLGLVVRQRVGIGSYGGWVCAAAALALTPVVRWNDTVLTGFDTTQTLLLAACVVGPQLLGHNGFNYALRFLPAATVSSLLLLEPVGATLLAAWVLEEIPPWSAVGGGVLVIWGVGAAVHGSSATEQPD